MQGQLELIGMQENFEEMGKSYARDLNQRNVQWSGLLHTLSKGSQ